MPNSAELAVMSLIRTCFTDVPGILTASGRQDRRFDGVLASLVNIHAEGAGKHWNMSLVPEKIIGTLRDPVTGSFDGCMGNLQRNESDVGFVLISSPVHGPNITQGFPLGASQIFMLSSYKPVAQIVDTDIMYAFNSFSKDVWFVIALFVTALLALLLISSMVTSRVTKWNKMCRKRRRVRVLTRGRPSNPIMFLGSRLLRQSAYRSAPTPLIIVTIFCFLIHLYFTSLIKTELSIIRKPVTVNTYDDVLREEKLLPVWFGAFPHYALFKYAPSGSIQRRIWEKAIKMSKGDEDAFLFEMDHFTSRNTAWETYLDQESVVFDGSDTIRATRKNACAFVSSLEKGTALSHVAVDPGSKETITVFPHQQLVHWCQLSTAAQEGGPDL